MSTTDTTATQDRPPRSGKAIDPALLEFPDVYFNQGEYRIEATYPSASDPATRHSVVLAADGRVVYHAAGCKGHDTHGHCLHTDPANGREMVAEFWRRDYRGRDSRALVAEDRWLAALGPLTGEQALQMRALGDVIGERFIAAHGRVEALTGATGEGAA